MQARGSSGSVQHLPQHQQQQHRDSFRLNPGQEILLQQPQQQQQQQAVYNIPVSHPSHPQHQNWLQAQQQQQQNNHAGPIKPDYPSPDSEPVHGSMQSSYSHMQHSMAPSAQFSGSHHPSIRVNTSFANAVAVNGPLSAGGPHSATGLPSGAIAPSPHALNARPLPSPSLTHLPGQGGGAQQQHSEFQRPGPPVHSNSYSGPMGSTSGRASPLLDPRGPPPMPSTTPAQFRQLPAQVPMRPPPPPAIRPELLFGAQLVAQG